MVGTSEIQNTEYRIQNTEHRGNGISQQKKRDPTSTRNLSNSKSLNDTHPQKCCSSYIAQRVVYLNNSTYFQSHIVAYLGRYPLSKSHGMCPKCPKLLFSLTAHKSYLMSSLSSLSPRCSRNQPQSVACYPRLGLWNAPLTNHFFYHCLEK